MLPAPGATRMTAFDPIDMKPVGPIRKRLRLGLMHHHLGPGGVTSVIRDIALALAGEAGFDRLQIDIFASVRSKASAQRIFGGIERIAPGRLRIVDIPGLAYRKEPRPNRESFMRAARKLAKEIMGQIDLAECDHKNPYILHSQNISLGKNPTATMALRLIARAAIERKLPLWLINHIHDFAENNRPEQMRSFYGCSGRRDEAFARGFMYPNLPNIVYLTINSADIDNLLTMGISRDRIFLMPDPIDSEPYTKGPLWERSERELATIELKPTDFKGLMVRRLEGYVASKNQVFDPSLPILLSPLKVMRRKNNSESLLLLTLFRRLGHDYQLLISLDANSPSDAAYSKRLKDFALRHRIPVTIGFGHELISEGGGRRISKGVVKQFGLCDLYALCEGVLTTSVVEGFGLAYHEGWLCKRPVVGRKIPQVVRDFEAAGMSFDHTYEKMAVSLDDLPDLGNRLRREYGEEIRKSRLGPKAQEIFPPHPSDDIVDAKIFSVGGADCIDFADLSLNMQLELIDKLDSDLPFADRFVERNPAVARSLEIIGNRDSQAVERLINSNAAATRRSYSLKATAERLKNIYRAGDSIYMNADEPKPLTAENHAAIIQRYQHPENLRLIF